MAAISDQDKLRLLLPHWIEHNAEHASEFRHWAEKAGPAQEHILRAADNLEEVNRILGQALQELGGPLKQHDRTS